MATFASVVDAIGCAVAMQQATERQARTAGTPIAIRVGLSVGEVTFEGDDVFGAPVVEAARLVAAADQWADPHHRHRQGARRPGGRTPRSWTSVPSS